MAQHQQNKQQKDRYSATVQVCVGGVAINVGVDPYVDTYATQTWSATLYLSFTCMLVRRIRAYIVYQDGDGGGRRRAG